jgi:hypothetical protein
MTSQLNVDTIVDKAGSGGSNVKMANTSTYVSEGGAKTANNVVQGLAKAWVSFRGTSTVTIHDSLNMTSVTDVDTGSYTPTINNDMANDTYSPSGGVFDSGETSSSNFLELCTGGSSTMAVGSCNISTRGTTTGTRVDATQVNISFHGDLA